MSARRPRYAAWLLAASTVLSGAVGLLPGASASPASRSVSAVRQPLVRGADISWPECPKGVGIPGRRGQGEPMPSTSNTFAIVGLTNGPGFHPNPCISRQLRWVRRHHMQVGAYAMTTYPNRRERTKFALAGPFTDASHGTLRGAHVALRNAGYAEAMFNQRTMQREHLAVPMVWIDVEPYTPWAPWSSNKIANRAVVSGVIRGYRDLGYQVGLYTYANGWAQVVGRWRLSSIPTWSTAGHLGNPRKALKLCTTGPSGGPTMVAQWYDPNRDYDLLCPSAQLDPAAIFTAN
jgi:hypothetical protein